MNPGVRLRQLDEENFNYSNAFPHNLLHTIDQWSLRQLQSMSKYLEIK